MKLWLNVPMPFDPRMCLKVSVCLSTQLFFAIYCLYIFTDKFQEMRLKTDDERYIRSMIENPISIVLLGNRPCVKARIANYILGYELLPVRVQLIIYIFD